MSRPAQASGAVAGTTSTDSHDWRHRGECAQIDYLPGGHRMHRHDPETWYPEGNSRRAAAQVAEARAICGRCPVIETCRREAIESDEQHGIWGGLTEKERDSIRRRLARAARAANPRPTTKPAPAKPAPAKAAPAKPQRPISCGTMPGYRRHIDAHEPACDPCKAARRAASAKERQRRRQRGQTEHAA